MQTFLTEMCSPFFLLLRSIHSCRFFFLHFFFFKCSILLILLQVCLDRCLDYSPCCPLCKTSLVEDYAVNRNNSNNNSIRSSTSPSGTNFSLATYASSKKTVTRFIECAMQRFIPLAYRKRQLQEIEKEPSVPVFICTTAYPNVPCPLYVYEPRHRLMIR